jgi:hypothetical protein
MHKSGYLVDPPIELSTEDIQRRFRRHLSATRPGWPDIGEDSGRGHNLHRLMEGD